MEDLEKGVRNETVIDAEVSEDSRQKETSSQETTTPSEKIHAGEVMVMIADSEERKGEGELQTSPEVPEVKDNKDQETKEEDEKKTEDPEAEEDEKKDGEKPLLDEKDTVTIDLGRDDEKLPGEDTPTLPLGKKKGEEEKGKEEAPNMFLHPIDTMRHAWQNSKSVPEFFLRAIVILFASLGWLFCVGGVPLLPLVMLIIGSVFVNDCPYEPNIPIYLIVAGLFGMIEHVCAVVTKYLPKEKRGFMEKHRNRCQCMEAILQIFLFLWFIAGCVWVYGIYEPHYDDPYHREYCHKTVYLFTFWMFNISFIILCSIIVFGLCAMMCVVAAAVHVARADEGS